MIIAALMGFAFQVVQWIVHMFPVIELPGEIVSGLSTIITAAGQLNSVLPIAEMFMGLGFYLTLWLATLLVQFGIYVYRLIPIFGGH